jgi:hypothetical protein
MIDNLTLNNEFIYNEESNVFYDNRMNKTIQHRSDVNIFAQKDKSKNRIFKKRKISVDLQ